ncbi:MAG: metalloregulator ArsR/SmtB family transcription factor [candidate division KSB1 bacterium]|nr:metalloregulator ArsR/SmtB family transcription factor [candidate division KSB1 bacterium]
MIFRALGDVTRIRILNLFLQSNEQICVCELMDALHLPQYTVSKHLHILRTAGLIRSGRKGTWVYNQLNREHSVFLEELFKLLKKQLADQYPEDIESLHQRLDLREDGVCTVGVI